jgi:ubiquinone/menaquinone biosynthesis C-methylase UbiE
MDIDIIRAINKLWLPVYPGIAKQIAGHWSRPPERMLEVGCFSGGIGLTLLRQCPQSTLTIAMEVEELVATFPSDWQEMLDTQCADRYRVVSTPLYPLTITGQKFDLIICRGVFFFLDEKGTILSELFRLLSSGGIVFAGGGFGTYTSPEVIKQLADESRRLNYALGRKLFSRQDFELALSKAGLAEQAEVIDEGGLWVVIKKL